MDDILLRLRSDCPFPKLFEDVEEGSRTYAPVYRQKIGHIRADHDGWRWWNTWWPTHPELMIPARGREIDRLYNALTNKDHFADLPAMTRFCHAHPEACIDFGRGSDEYDFYYEGDLCNYWLRMILRRGDYNLYLHAFMREEAL